jgi:hypothetical protein
MNRNRLAALLLALAGSTAGGVALVNSVLSAGAPLKVQCYPDGGDCLMVALPTPEQCPVLLEGGGDRPGEVTPIDDRDEHKAARILTALMEHQAIVSWHTDAVPEGCRVAIFLRRDQADAWRQVLTGKDELGNGLDGEDVLIDINVGNPVNIPIVLGGQPPMENRTEVYDLAVSP